MRFRLAGEGGAAMDTGTSRRGFLAGAASTGLAGTGLSGTGIASAGVRSGQNGHAAAGRSVALAIESPAEQNQALTPWFAGLSNRLTARCNVVCLGDSVTEGVHAQGPPATGFQNRWLARLADGLRARYPTQALTGGGRGFIGAASTGEPTFTWPTTIGGGPA